MATRGRAGGGDAFLYWIALVYAVVTAVAVSNDLYREWARIAIAPYAAGVVAALILGRRRDWPRVRWWLAVAVFVLAAALPLSLEVAWRARTSPGSHAQSEAIITEEAANVFFHGHNPYSASYAHGPLSGRPLGTQTHFPYLPVMLLFGLPRALDQHHPWVDARIYFTIATLALGFVALRQWPAPPTPKLRAIQVLAVLPTGALLMATGGDDLPVVGLLLLALVLAHERRILAAGLVLGVAAATKQTAWILVPFLVVAILRRDGRHAAIRLAAAATIVTVPVAALFEAWRPRAFWEDVALFPMGLGEQPSSAATPTLGSFLTNSFPSHRLALTVLFGIIVLAAGIAMLLVRPPRSVADAAWRAGALFAMAYFLAPTARAGYVVYPIDLLTWAGALRAWPLLSPT